MLLRYISRTVAKKVSIEALYVCAGGLDILKMYIDIYGAGQPKKLIFE